MSTKQKISPEEIYKIAHLAKLRPSAAECDLYASQISEIVEYVQQLEAVDCEGVEPLAHVLDLMNVTRDDKVADSLPKSEVMANAPILIDSEDRNSRASDGDYFLVPEVLKIDR